MIKYKKLKAKHPEHAQYCEHWGRIDALHTGGHKLLYDNKGEWLHKLLLKWANETDASYANRIKFASYENHMAAVVEHIVAQLKTDPITVTDGLLDDVEASSPKDGKPKTAPKAAMDDIYEDFLEDCTPYGKEELTFASFLAAQARQAILFRAAWTLVDLPRLEPGRVFVSEQEQREAGALEPFVVSVDPRLVFDWGTDRTGAITWALVYDEYCPRDSFLDERDKVIECFTIYTQTEWLRFEIARKPNEKIDDDTELTPVARGTHAFGRCPLIRFDVSDELWLGDRIESLVREHFNTRNSLGEFGRKAAYPQLYEFCAPSMGSIDEPINEHQADAQRAHVQPRGPGLVQVRGNEDKAMYVSPDAGAYKQLSDETDKIRESIYRVTHQMALSQDNKGALIRRSAESKGIDNAATAIIGAAIGQHLRSHAREIITAIERGVADRQEHEWKITGATKFDAATGDQIIERAAVMAAVEVPSPTFKALHALNVAKAALDGNLSASDLAQIREELDGAFTAEDEAAKMAAKHLGDAGLEAPGNDQNQEN